MVTTNEIQQRLNKAQDCAMYLNGVNLFSTCGLDRLTVGRDGVCVAAVDVPNEPRAACFDTRVAGEGVEQLFSWIEEQQQGVTVMVVTCSRLAFPFNRDRVRQAMRLIGARDPPMRVDDAYVLIGTRGGADETGVVLSEKRLPCCVANGVSMNGLMSHVCTVCDNTPTSVNATTACGVPAPSSDRPSVLSQAMSQSSLTYRQAQFGRPEMTSAIVSASRVPLVMQAQMAADTSVGMGGLVGSMQTQDADDALDLQCTTGLAASATLSGSRFGGTLASDGDMNTYWQSVGRPDAVLTVELPLTTRIQTLIFHWRDPAYAVLVLASDAVAGDEWVLIGQYQSSTKSQPPFRVALSSDNNRGAVARRLRIYMMLPQDESQPHFGLYEVEAESCDPPEVNASAPLLLLYTNSSTPVVRSVAPKRGSTAGGTVLTMMVDHLPVSITPSDITVLVAGILCAVTHAADTNVTCVTGSYGRTIGDRTGEGSVELTIAGVGTAIATEDCAYEYVDLWSRVSTWGGIGNSIPGVGGRQLDSVWIQRGQKVVLDLDVRIYMLIVEGQLEFEQMDVYLDVNFIFVFNGAFIVGTETEPFLHRAVITLYGSPVSAELPIYGSKTLSCRFCTLDLHGRPVLDGRTHTKLARSAYKGETELWLMEPVDWCVGDYHTCQIAISSTRRDGDPWHMEDTAIKRVTNDGLRLELQVPLAFDHLGETRYLSDGYSVEFRANVALISSNVMIQGEPTFSALDQHGGHIMLHSRRHRQIADQSKGESLSARIENVELRYMGQFGRLGRYPVHFHMIGSVRNSYLRYNRIHHTFHRCISVHGVHHLRVIENVCYLNKGHSIFVEDAVETKNIIQRNIVIGTRPCFSCLNSDMTPASYWLVNPDNYVERNIAAGSTHYGFWWFLEGHVVGASGKERGSESVCPPGTPLLRFADNEAHNNGKAGMRLGSASGMYAPKRNPCKAVGHHNPYQTAEFLRTYVWRNKQKGVIVGALAAVHLVDFVTADNGWKNIEFRGVMETKAQGGFGLDGGWGAVALVRPLIVGHDLPCPQCDRDPALLAYGAKLEGWGSGFDGFPRPWIRHGIATPHNTGLYVTGATFINFDRSSMIAVTGAHHNCEECPYGIQAANGVETRFRATTWIESDYRVRWRWANEAMFRDLDGTFTQRDFCENPKQHQQCVVASNSIISDRRAMPECYPDRRYSWGVCKGDTQLLSVTSSMSNWHSMEKQATGVGYQLRRNSSAAGAYLDPEDPDMAYLRDRWYAEGPGRFPFGKSWTFVKMSLSTDQLSASLGDGYDKRFWASWNSARGRWLDRYTIEMTWHYKDQFDLRGKSTTLVGDLSADDSTLVWRGGADWNQTAYQLMTQLTWYRCAVYRKKCASSPARYDRSLYSSHGSNYAVSYLPGKQRYSLTTSVPQLGHQTHVGPHGLQLQSHGVMLPGDWMEFESNPLRAYLWTSFGAYLSAESYPGSNKVVSPSGAPYACNFGAWCWRAFARPGDQAVQYTSGGVDVRFDPERQMWTDTGGTSLGEHYAGPRYQYGASILGNARRLRERHERMRLHERRMSSLEDEMAWFILDAQKWTDWSEGNRAPGLPGNGFTYQEDHESSVLRIAGTTPSLMSNVPCMGQVPCPVHPHWAFPKGSIGNGWMRRWVCRSLSKFQTTSRLLIPELY